MDNEKEVIMKCLEKAIEINRWVIDGRQITIIPTELAVRLYNYLYGGEALIMEGKHEN